MNYYIANRQIRPDERLFPLSSGGARATIVRASKTVGVHVRPHDLGRFAATHASRSGVSIEIVSKVILRHSNLAATQVYFGAIIDDPVFSRIEDINR